jgi:hypothetical protein
MLCKPVTLKVIKFINGMYLNTLNLSSELNRSLARASAIEIFKCCVDTFLLVRESHRWHVLLHSCRFAVTS